MKKYLFHIGLLAGCLVINLVYADTSLSSNNGNTTNAISNASTNNNIASNNDQPLLNDDNTTTTTSTFDTSSTVDNTPTTTIALPGDEHVIWDKRPIPFVIPTGKERMISFPDTVALINDNHDLTADKLSVMINNGTIYFKALQAFASTRVTIKLQQTGEYILLDISASDNADDAPVDVVMSSSASHDTDNHTASSNNTTTSYIDLLRFAVQSLYAPERLITQSFAIIRVPMYTHKSVSLFYGGNTIAMPIISWQGGDYFATAVIIKNTTAQSIVLDPRQIKGHWLAASFYPTNQLASMGKLQDKTTVFLISTTPFGNALTDNNEESR